MSRRRQRAESRVLDALMVDPYQPKHVVGEIIRDRYSFASVAAWGVYRTLTTLWDLEGRGWVIGELDDDESHRRRRYRMTQLGVAAALTRPEAT